MQLREQIDEDDESDEPAASPRAAAIRALDDATVEIER